MPLSPASFYASQSAALTGCIKTVGWHVTNSPSIVGFAIPS